MPSAAPITASKSPSLLTSAKTGALLACTFQVLLGELALSRVKMGVLALPVLR
ncbi:MAG: hypothetical protein HEQ12_00665 [Aphanizomenon flos-aquae DEX188]|nr:MAG: hypothetical protein HEQ12_00665 [Aphanizomenon flos-aquae DEX188]